MNEVMTFLQDQFFNVVMVATCIVVLIIILGRDRGKLVGLLIKNFFIGVVVAAILFFAIKLPIKVVGTIGISVFGLSALFGSLARKK